MMTKEQVAALRRPFSAEDIEWRVGQAGKGSRGPWVKVLAYLTSRAVMERLDEVFGVGGWSHSIREISLGGSFGVACVIRAGGCEHEDVAECSDIEALKGAASGALKRAAVHFGVGRYLYFLEEGFGRVHEGGKFRHFGKDKRSGDALDFRWDPPALPAWALPAPGSEPYNPYAQAPSKENEPPLRNDQAPDPLFVPENIPSDFVDGIRKMLTMPDGVKQLRKALAAAGKACSELGIELDAVDAKAFPVEIANAVLDAKSRILDARRAAA